ncbi:MAG: glycine cleavage system protein H [Betaproteobacteria bacterium RIFCSPLOWO2_02_FULL_67_26]|nr:MAG: glycine cleavage system protein H [Betaproteobacteria bacterium RIFCSPLOWO2_02_FULL_67_26]
MKIPDNLKYTATHQWVRVEADGTETVGITFHAQEQLGDVVFVQHPVIGRKVKQGEACAVVESVKAASDIPAPVSGEIVAVNAALADAPEKLNQEPYAAWLFRIRPADASEFGALLDATAYRELVAGG